MNDDVITDGGERRVSGLAAAVRRLHPARTSHVSHDALAVFVREGIAAAATLGVTDDGDVLRFMCLPLAFSREQSASAMIRALATRVLDRTEWSGGKRLDFIYRHLVPRMPDPASESYLRPLFQRDADDTEQ
jgi:hypothetical protein